jgi:hypothetical protein
MNTQQQTQNDLLPGVAVMASTSLEGLLAWMKDTSRMLGWDLIVALDGRKLNLGLQHDHIIRLSQGNDLGVITGSMDIPDTNITHYLSGFRLTAPRLSFDRASLQSARTALNLAVVGGTQMMVETVNGQKKILSLTTLDPLDGSQLTLDVPLAANAGNVVLDLANSENVLLTLFRTANEQREAGKLFKDWFDRLANDQRIHSLATLPGEGNPLMYARGVDVRTQQRETSALAPESVNENGAVLLFASLVDGGSGDFPGDNSGFKYLIPDDDAQNSYSATELFSRALIHRAAFGHALLQMLDDAEFEHIANGAGSLAKMVAKRGALKVAAGSYQTLEYEFESDPFSLPAVGGAMPLTIEFDQHQVVQRWQVTFSLTFGYRPLGGTTRKTYTPVLNINLLHEFRFWADESGVSAMEGELSTPYTHTQEVSIESGLPSMPASELEQINDFVTNTVKRALLEGFSNTLTSRASETYLADVDIVGNSTLQASHVALPFDQAMFGQINASGASFSIVQQQPLVGASRPLQLTTEPARENLRWTLESLAGDDGDPGRIDEQTGLYRAPPAHAMDGSFNRVLAIASDNDTDERSVTLITVQANPITINPQIQLCSHGQRVELTAGQLDRTALSWTIKNPVPGESGQLTVSTEPGGDHTYTAAPRVANKTYVLDEIEVNDNTGDETASAYVLVLQNEPLITVKIVENNNLPEGQVQLQASINGSTVRPVWSLPLDGPGSINQSGLYIDDMGTRERFVLINASLDGEFGKYEGHLILPLPLADFPIVISALAE